MALYCPHCGAEAPDEARFCMRCGRERPPFPHSAPPPAAPPAPGAHATLPAPSAPPAPFLPPAVPPLPGTPPVPYGGPAAATGAAQPVPSPFPAFPPPPGHVPQSAQPTAVGAFLGRALRGDWAGAAQAAIWPVGLLIVMALAFAVPSYGQASDDIVVGFADRMRLALASLLQGVGGSLKITGSSSYGDGTAFGDASSSGTAAASATLSVTPLLLTVLWILVLLIGVRIVRIRLHTHVTPGVPGSATAGLEAAVRIVLLVTGATLLLSLIAQPDIRNTTLSTAPFLTALWTLLLSLGVAGGALYQDDLRHRIAEARPGTRLAVRACGTAVRAMGLVLLIAAVLGYLGLMVLGPEDANSVGDLVGSGASSGERAVTTTAFVLLLPNLALGVLGLSWGAPLEARGGGGDFGGGGTYEAFGLSRLGDELGGGAVGYALALGLVCALAVAVLVARRAAQRGEQLLSVGLFFGLFLLLVAVGGLGTEATGDLDPVSMTIGHLELGLSMPDAVLFGLLWSAGAAVAAVWMSRIPALSPAPAAPYGGPPGFPPDGKASRAAE